MAAAGTAIGSYTEAYEFRTEGLRAAREIVETSGIRGTRSMPIERTRDGTVRINGTIAAPTDPPYIWSDAVCTVEGSARVVTRWELSIDNQLNARFSNSNTATDIHTQGRVVTVSMTVPYTSDEVDLYGINSSGASGATFVLTNGGRSITFTIGALAVADSSPGVSGPGEILLEMNGIAKSSGSTKELSITSDSTA